MRKQNVRMAWYLAGAFLIGQTVLVVSCGMIEPPSPPPPVAAIAPPVIPHSIEGRADCRVCHATGVGGAPQFPTSHTERPSDVCLVCHVPASVNNEGNALPTMTTHSVETTTPASISAKELYEAKCAVCHGISRQGVSGLAPALTPESLAVLSDVEIRDTILNGKSGTAMSAFKGTISPKDVDSLLQLIKYTLPIAPATSPAPGPISQDDSVALKAKGEEIYQKPAGGIGCKSCHGVDGKGVPNTAPDVRGKSADDITRALNGDVMNFINLTEEDIMAVATYLKYLESQP